MKKQVKEGDIILVNPVESPKIRAKVLFRSTRFKHVVLLGFFKENNTTNSVPDTIVYCSSQSIADGKWPIVGSEPISKPQRELSLRVVAGNVWEKDTYIRPATPDDEKSLPEMLVYGDQGVRKIVESLNRTPS